MRLCHHGKQIGIILSDFGVEYLEQDPLSDGISEAIEDPLCPEITISKEGQRVCKPWRRSVIVKLLGTKVGIRFMQLIAKALAT